MQFVHWHHVLVVDFYKKNSSNLSFWNAFLAYFLSPPARAKALARCRSLCLSCRIWSRSAPSSPLSKSIRSRFDLMTRKRKELTVSVDARTISSSLKSKITQSLFVTLFIFFSHLFLHSSTGFYCFTSLNEKKTTTNVFSIHPMHLPSNRLYIKLLPVWQSFRWCACFEDHDHQLPNVCPVELYNPKRNERWSLLSMKIIVAYFGIFPIGNAWRNLPILLFFDSDFTCRRVKNWSWRTWWTARKFFVDSIRENRSELKERTSIISTYLNRGGSMGSFCTSTIWMMRCLAPELNAAPCCEGV